MSKETTLLDYAMFIAHERELCVQGLPSDEAAAKERFIAAADRELRNEIAPFRHIGGKLASIAFNLAKRPGQALPPETCSLLDKVRKDWDTAMSKERAK